AAGARRACVRGGGRRGNFADQSRTSGYGNRRRARTQAFSSNSCRRQSRRELGRSALSWIPSPVRTWREESAAHRVRDDNYCECRERKRTQSSSRVCKTSSVSSGAFFGGFGQN